MKKLKFLLAFFVLAIVLNGCKKDVEQKQVEPTAVKQTIKLANKKNPFSLKNIREVKNKRLQNTAQRTISNPNINVDRVWVYVQFNPERVTGDILAKLEADADIHIMDIPFANFELYNDDFALDEEKAELLKDGKLYAVYKKNSAMNDLFIAENGLETQFLDELYLPEESESEDVDLYMQALLQAGYTQEQANRWFNICLFKKAHGRVNYFDTELNNFQPVAGMQVWALVFGIPVHTYTDANGNYEIPWRFSVGTIIGTKAKNPRVNIKPLDVHGTLARNVYTLITQFIVGSIHIEGWKSSCQMRNDIDMNFSGHTQVRFWSHLLNAYYLHDQYTNQDGIMSAPQAMVCYAGWTNDNGLFDILNRPQLRDATTPLFGHVSYIKGLFEYLLNDVFGANVNLANNYPSVFSLLKGVLPDMYLGVAQSGEPSFYSSRIMQFAFHELGHASQYRQVGNAWYIALQWAERPFPNPNSVSGNPYGDGQNSNSGIVSLAESWAEFIGTNYTIRRYGNLAMKSATSTGELNSNPFTLGNFETDENLMESESFFFRGQWIPYGAYNDLMDNFNTNEFWDNVSGTQINQMYYTFGPNVKSTCDFASNFINNYPLISSNGGFDLMLRYGMICW